MFKKQGSRIRVPIVICIDIEPDKRVVNPGSAQDWLGFQAGWEPLQRCRTALSRSTGSPAHFNWFVRIDPQIEYCYGAAGWAINRYRPCFAEMSEAGDEVGLHPHSWRWRESERQWVSDFADQSWVEHCVRQGFAHFERQFKRPCHSFRFGDRWLNNQTVALLERLGTKFDLTIEPGRRPEELPESFTGALPDYAQADRRPYRPATADFLQRGDAASQRDLWHIPISTASPSWDCLPLSPDARRRLKTPFRADYEGFFDRVDQTRLQGWVYDARRPNDTVCIDLYDNDQFLATYAADFFREDLSRAGKGSGAHGFEIAVPEQLRDGQPHNVGIRVAGTKFELQHSPRTGVWQPTGLEDDYVTLNLAADHQKFRRLCNVLLDEQQASFLAFVLRTDVFSDNRLQAEFEHNLNYLATHPRASDFVLTTPAEALEILQVESAC